MFQLGFKKALSTSAFFIFAVLSWGIFPAAAETALVRHVLDGDSFVLADGRHMRLIGINAPELGKDGAPDQPLARQSRTSLSRLVNQQQVKLAYEQERQDHYGRWLVHAYLPDGKSVGEDLLRDGLAWTVAIPPNIEKLDSLLKIENEARAAGRGLWGIAFYQPTPVADLAPTDTGFRFIEGTVLRRGQGRDVLYFDLAPRVALVVPRADWKKYFNGKPTDLIGRRVIARGWLTQSRGRLHLRVPHPAMLTWRD